MQKSAHGPEAHFSKHKTPFFHPDSGTGSRKDSLNQSSRTVILPLIEKKLPSLTSVLQIQKYLSRASQLAQNNTDDLEPICPDAATFHKVLMDEERPIILAQLNAVQRQQDSAMRGFIEKFINKKHTKYHEWREKVRLF